MALIRNHKVGNIVFEAPYFDNLLTSQPQGCLPREIGAHALWHYYCIAKIAYDKACKNLVYEGEPDVEFNALGLINGIALMHGIDVETMVRYWPVIERQRFALGLSSNADIPERFKFRGAKSN